MNIFNRTILAMLIGACTISAAAAENLGCGSAQTWTPSENGIPVAIVLDRTIMRLDPMPNSRDFDPSKLDQKMDNTPIIAMQAIAGDIFTDGEDECALFVGVDRWDYSTWRADDGDPPKIGSRFTVGGAPISLRFGALVIWDAKTGEQVRAPIGHTLTLPESENNLIISFDIGDEWAPDRKQKQRSGSHWAPSGVTLPKVEISGEANPTINLNAVGWQVALWLLHNENGGRDRTKNSLGVFVDGDTFPRRLENGSVLVLPPGEVSIGEDETGKLRSDTGLCAVSNNQIAAIARSQDGLVTEAELARMNFFDPQNQGGDAPLCAREKRIIQLGARIEF